MVETETSKDEQIGFHKGSLSTLSKEREELMKIISIVEQLMQMHVKALKDQGIDLQKMAEQAKKPNVGSTGVNTPIEDIIK